MFKKFRKIAIDDGMGGVRTYLLNCLQKLRVDNLPEVCDKLGLHLLMNSEDMSFHFKYVDVVNGTANAYLDDGEGYIDFEK